MGKVTIYCQLSGCTPEAESQLMDNIYEDEYSGDSQLATAIKLLSNRDETEGQQALTIIGPLADDGKTWLEISSVEEALGLPEGRVRAISGCTMGNMFDMGFCDGPEGGPDGALISFGSCFYVLTNMLPILEAATGGRVNVRRLWNLSMMKGHLLPHDYDCIPGVTYGPIEHYWEQFPWMLGDISRSHLPTLEQEETPEEIAEIIRSWGHWMWMRPDRFPIELSRKSRSAEHTLFIQPGTIASHNLITRLPPEILYHLLVHLPLSDIISLALVDKAFYGLLLRNADTRDFIAKAYMRYQAPWFMPYGKAELKWWNERNGDEALGWEYLKMCRTRSHSMRNRERIWKTAESIEEECEKEERAWARKF